MKKILLITILFLGCRQYQGEKCLEQTFAFATYPDGKMVNDVVIQTCIKTLVWYSPEGVYLHDYNSPIAKCYGQEYPGTVTRYELAKRGEKLNFKQIECSILAKEAKVVEAGK